MSDIRVVILVGSLRADSLNRGIAEIIRTEAPEGISVEIAEGLDRIPFYNEDLDGETVPAAAAELRALVGGADRLLAVVPEYNGSMPAVIKNAIDWLSRPYGVGVISGVPFGVVGVAPSPFGGKWAHDDTARSAGVAGAVVVEAARLDQNYLEVDVLADADVRANLREVLRALVDHEVEVAAA